MRGCGTHLLVARVESVMLMAAWGGDAVSIASAAASATPPSMSVSDIVCVWAGMLCATLRGGRRRACCSALHIYFLAASRVGR
jgi:hypothetical protein